MQSSPPRHIDPEELTTLAMENVSLGVTAGGSFRVPLKRGSRSPTSPATSPGIVVKSLADVSGNLEEMIAMQTFRSTTSTRSRPKSVASTHKRAQSFDSCGLDDVARMVVSKVLQSPRAASQSLTPSLTLS